jgi:uncharacterized protein (TIGR02594 family)
MSHVEPKWIELARSFIGLDEVKGEKHNPDILQFWKDIKRGGIKTDEVPWCAAFVGAMLERCGIQSSRYESAKSYLTWGTALAEPAYGCVVVFTRDGGGHVGFVVGRGAKGNLLVLGGNQSDEVNIKSFPLDRVAGYRWPVGQQGIAQVIPHGSADLSTTEA